MIAQKSFPRGINQVYGYKFRKRVGGEMDGFSGMY